ncbi:NlpC/P60 family protein [Paroceanicella profunda]|uniref:NlpC/P60 family protein n=1 Tax=Paroceanicella profunda TaxID=2579971 RepID=A0A5B8FZ45_9RHOB|nr:NlpC/P60 family protein [Paroceanicella profunda]QDL91979.1 NlpC/P60 family protein [Paroceanicella profunda]
MAGPDLRRTPARPDLAAAHLRGRVTAERFAEAEPARVSAAVAPMWTGPDAARRGSELLFGEIFDIYERRDGLAWGQARADGYMGYVPEDALAAPAGDTTARVSAPLAHLYPEPDIKAPPRLILPQGSRLTLQGGAGRFRETPDGFVIATHVALDGRPAEDWVAVAESLRGAPYLWGGRSMLGIDCSALVQQALTAAGTPCPRDTDMQAAELGTALAPGSALRRGDLVFWKGHVGVMLDETVLLHANAWHMQVAQEPLDGAIARIAAQDGGPVTARRRP